MSFANWSICFENNATMIPKRNREIANTFITVPPFKGYLQLKIDRGFIFDISISCKSRTLQFANLVCFFLCGNTKTSGRKICCESNTKTIPPPLQNNSFRFTSHPPH